ncbi:TetR/AcrR family transcriptional regulator [Emticicia sp. BO119]|uniref:TetR/AcrR family transcriptional regulator n=1 Tax=Emticicia sp. BO119 TaxID=2757768 RepID=UPI0015F02971|nr:TetR/AcrR family transcriptional regulator [Emticicia sp. BO119]MBA4850392.1 TetR/AcrR family transcriptional regulator [Emticicia sp. BO119]
MPKIDQDTKQKILIAAEKVFHRNGFKGTRTTQIAEEAGISRTMLHYYFRTKESLFQEILESTLNTVFFHMKRLIGEQVDLDILIEGIIEVVSDLFEDKPGLPGFIVNLFNESEELAYFLAHSREDTIPFQLNEILKNEKQQGTVSEYITGEDLIMNIYGLCAMPYLTMAYVKAKQNRDEESMKEFIRKRRSKIKAFVLNGIRP